MADVKLAYAANSSITITLTSLGSAVYRESTAIDNTTMTWNGGPFSLTIAQLGE